MSYDLIIITIIMVSNQMNKKEEKCSDLYTNIIHKAFQFMLKKNSYNFCTGSEDTLRAWTVSNLCQHKYQCSIPRNLTKKAACSCNVCLVSEDISRAWTLQCPLLELSGQDTGGEHVGSALPSDWADNCICPIENTVGIHLFLSKYTQRYNTWF